MTVPEGDGQPGRDRPNAPVHRYRVLGVTLATGLPLAVDLPQSDEKPAVTLTHAGALPAGWSPGDRDPAYESDVRLSDGSPPVRLFTVPAGHLLRMGGIGDFCLATDEVMWVPVSGAESKLGTALGAVLAVWLELRGSTVVHGSAVELAGGAVGFLGAPRAGKSTLAGSFIGNGGRLLADDALAMEIRQDLVIVHPGFPQSRLWPDSAAYLMPEPEQTGVLHQRADGKRIVSRLHAATFCDRPQHLRRLYLLARHPDRSGVEITPFVGASVVIELLRHSFIARAARALGLERILLKSLSEIAARLDVKRLDYPADYRRLGEVQAAITEDLAGLARRRTGG